MIFCVLYALFRRLPFDHTSLFVCSGVPSICFCSLTVLYRTTSAYKYLQYVFTTLVDSITCKANVASVLVALKAGDLRCQSNSASVCICPNLVSGTTDFLSFELGKSLVAIATPAESLEAVIIILAPTQSVFQRSQAPDHRRHPHEVVGAVKTRIVLCVFHDYPDRSIHRWQN